MKITIDGSVIEAESGKSLLEAARENGIAIPSLCDHPQLIPFSGCRLCLVEVKDQRGFLPSCSTKCEEGMEVKTRTPQILDLRKRILELILSEHPNACLICGEKKNCDELKSTIRKVGEVTGCVLCSNNGRCELQSVTEEIGLERVGHSSVYRELDVRRADPFFDRNYNLCILCGRCVRICREVRGLSTLSFIQRGSETVVGAALDKNMLEAGCQFCGACVDVCPTGALTEKGMKYLGLPTENTQAVCGFCSLGCRLDVFTRENRILYSRPAWDGPVNQGQACVKGRFMLKETVHSPGRILRPMVRKEQAWEEVAWDDALTLVADKLRTYKAGEIALVDSPQASLEDGFVLRKLAKDVLKTKNLHSFAENSAFALTQRLLGKTGFIKGLKGAEAGLADPQTLVVLGTNVAVSQPLIWVNMFKAICQGADLLLISPLDYPFSRYAAAHLKPRPGSESLLLAGITKLLLEREEGSEAEKKSGFQTFAQELEETDFREIEELTGISSEALKGFVDRLTLRKAPLFLFGAETTSRPDGEILVARLHNLALQTGGQILPLGLGSNERGLLGLDRSFSGKWAAGPEIREKLKNREIKALYQTGPFAVPRKSKLEFRVVQGAFWDESAEKADVVLPSVTFVETEGVYVNAEGRIQGCAEAVKPAGDARPGWWILTQLAKKLKAKNLNYSKTGDIWKDIRREVDAFSEASAALVLKGEQVLFIKDTSSPGPEFLSVGKGDPPVSTSKNRPLLWINEANLDIYQGLVFSQEDKGFRLFRNEARFRMNPDDAKSLDLEDKDDVVLVSSVGEFSGTLCLDERVPPGTVATALAAFHFEDNRISGIFPATVKRGA